MHNPEAPFSEAALNHEGMRIKITIATGTGTIERIMSPAAKRRRRRCFKKGPRPYQDHHLTERDPRDHRHP
jgi:hypothetical protein